MELVQINETAEGNEEVIHDPLCRETVSMTIAFYKKVGFVLPWIGYLAKQDGHWVGAAGFKGKPVDGTIEIAYGTFEDFRNQGVGTAMCKKLVELSIDSDPSIKITARTLPEENYSTKILTKNNFILNGIVNDPEDGDVWEWVFKNG